MPQQINFAIVVPLPAEPMASVVQHERFIVALKQFLSTMEPPGDAMMSLVVSDVQTPKPRRHRRTRREIRDDMAKRVAAASLEDARQLNKLAV